MSRRDDFHNGRRYAADPPDGSPGGMLGWLKAVTNRLFKKAVEPTDIPPIAPTGRNAPFSLLGAEQDPEPDRSGRPVFPMAFGPPGPRGRAPRGRRRHSRPAATDLHHQDR